MFIRLQGSLNRVCRQFAGTQWACLEHGFIPWAASPVTVYGVLWSHSPWASFSPQNLQPSPEATRWERAPRALERLVLGGVNVIALLSSPQSSCRVQPLPLEALPTAKSPDPTQHYITCVLPTDLHDTSFRRLNLLPSARDILCASFLLGAVPSLIFPRVHLSFLRHITLTGKDCLPVAPSKSAGTSPPPRRVALFASGCHCPGHPPRQRTFVFKTFDYVPIPIYDYSIKPMASAETASESYHSTLPLTPCDSENERSSEAAPMAGRKRSASEMEEPKRAPKSTRNGPETIEPEATPDFTLECPARPRTAKQLANDDLYIETDAPSLAPHLNIDFAVRPGKKWSELSRFKNAKCK